MTTDGEPSTSQEGTKTAESAANPPPPPSRRKLGRPSLETLPGIRNSLADLLIKVRRRKFRNAKLASVLVRGYGKLADILIAEQKAPRSSLDDIADEVLRAEIIRRRDMRLGLPAVGAPAQH